MDKQELRKYIRELRANIPLTEEAAAATQLCQLTMQLPEFQNSQRIALYWPSDHEIDCLPILNVALTQKKHCYLPVLRLQNRQTLGFASYDSQTPVIRNRYDILEPDLSYALPINPTDLDIIFVPLVGFDKNGWRLGRGGGYYDAAFADLQRSHSKKRPKLIGLGYECQRVDTIPVDTWDWKLDAVITEAKLYEFQNKPAA